MEVYCKNRVELLGRLRAMFNSGAHSIDKNGHVEWFAKAGKGLRTAVFQRLIGPADEDNRRVGVHIVNFRGQFQSIHNGHGHIGDDGRIMPKCGLTKRRSWGNR